MISIPIRPTFLVVVFLLVVPVVVVRSETALSFRSLGSSRPGDDSIRNLQNVTDNVNDVKNVTDNGDGQKNVTDDSTDGDKEDYLQGEYLQCRNDSDKFLDANPSITEGVNETESILMQRFPYGKETTIVGLTMVFLPVPMDAAGPICRDEGGILAKSGNYQFQCVVDEALLDDLELEGLDPNATVTANYMYLNRLEVCFANTEACNNIVSRGNLLSHSLEVESGWDCNAMTGEGSDFNVQQSAKPGTHLSAGIPQHHPWKMGTLAAFVVMPAAAGIAMTAL